MSLSIIGQLRRENELSHIWMINTSPSIVSQHRRSGIVGWKATVLAFIEGKLVSLKLSRAKKNRKEKLRLERKHNFTSNSFLA